MTRSDAVVERLVVVSIACGLRLALTHRTVVAALAACSSWWATCQPHTMCGCPQSKQDIAKGTAMDIAYTAYPQWATTHAGCPRIADLGAYMNDPALADPWGRPWERVCTARGIVVHSDGEDGEPFTADDIWSNR